MAVIDLSGRGLFVDLSWMLGVVFVVVVVGFWPADRDGWRCAWGCGFGFLIGLGFVVEF